MQFEACNKYTRKLYVYMYNSHFFPGITRAWPTKNQISPLILADTANILWNAKYNTKILITKKYLALNVL